MNSNLKKELTKRIDKIVSSYKRLDETCDAAMKLGCLEVEGELWKSIWGSFETMLDLLDYEIDSFSGGWIAWYIWNNECGSKGLSASKKKNKPIKNSKDLAELILKNI